MNKETKLKELLMKYTTPKPEYDGFFAIDLARKILKELDQDSVKVLLEIDSRIERVAEIARETEDYIQSQFDIIRNGEMIITDKGDK